MKGMTARGFTLIEVLVATVIFAQVTLVGATTLASVRRLSSQTRILQAQQQSMRNVLETIKRDVRCAKTDGLKINDSQDGFSLTNRSGDKNDYSLITEGATADRSIVKTNQLGENIKLTPDTIDVEEFIVKGVSNSETEPKPAGYVSVKIKLKSINQATIGGDSYEAETIAVPRGQKCE